MKRHPFRRLSRAHAAGLFAPATLTAAFLLAMPAHAQFRASIQGTVTDSSGAVIPGATITLTDIDTGRVLNAVSNSSGTYNFNALAPDHYKLSVIANGFQQTNVDSVTVNGDQNNGLNLQLAILGSSTTVDVNANATQSIETGTASISGTIDSNQIQHLAASGRDVFQLVQLAPGVFGDGAQSASSTGSQNNPGSQGPGASSRANGIFQTENGPQANANGGQYETNSVQIDGITTTSAVWGGTSLITPSEDSVGTLKVVSNGYDAENGRFSGAQIQVTSKTGTNQYHGSLFFRANRPGLNAYQRYNGSGTFTAGTPDQRGLQRDNARSNQYGGSVGGPILHNKLFAFFNYETQRDRSSQSGTGWYETPAFRALSPTGYISNTYNNFPGAPVVASAQIEQTCASIGLVEGVTCHQVPGQGLNLGSPLTSAKGTQDLTWVDNLHPGVGNGLTNTADIALYNTINPTTQVGTQYNGRLDGDVTKKDHLAFAVYFVPLSRTNYTGPNRTYNLFNHSQINEAYSVIYNRTFSPTFLNEARANDAGFRWNEVTSNPQEPFGLPTSQVDTIGTITLNSFGAPGPSVYNQHTFTYKDVATKIAGNHSIKFGGEVTRLYYLNNPTYSARPSYNFYNIWDFLNDAPHAESGSFLPATGTPGTNRQDNREDLYGFFAQDDWKVTPALTLNLGLRYSYFGPFSAKAGNLGVVQYGQGAAAYTGESIRTGGNLTTAQKGNFGPQFGFAYSPSMLRGKGVIRGGYGLNYNQSEIAITGNSGGNPPYVLNAAYNTSSITTNPATGVRTANIDKRILYAVATDPKSLFGYPANPNAIGGFNAANLPTAGGAFVTGFQQNQPTVYSHHYSLQTEFDVLKSVVLSVGYQGSLGRHNIIQSFPYILAVANGQAFNPLISNQNYFSNTGNSNNNQLLLGLKKQMSHGFMFDAEFQYAKSMDTGSGPYYVDPYPYRPDLAYGRSDYNFGKAFKLYGLWQPKFHVNYVSRLATDGWSVSGIYNLHTGFPFTPYYNTGNNVFYANGPTNNLRPTSYNGGGNKIRSNNAYEVGQANLNFPQQANLASGANSPYFGRPNSGIPTTGTTYTLPSLPGVARNSFDGPGYQDLDVTLAKKFVLPKLPVIGEDGGFEIRADFFNALNLTNLNGQAIDTNVQSSTFGQTNQGLAGRIINLQARFNF